MRIKTLTRYKRGAPPPRQLWVAAPLFNGERNYVWESTCLGYSANGLTWRQVRLGLIGSDWV